MHGTMGISWSVSLEIRLQIHRIRSGGRDLWAMQKTLPTPQRDSGGLESEEGRNK